MATAAESLDAREATRRERLREANRQEYGEAADTLNWVTPERAREAEQEREELLAALARGGAQTGCGGTKVDCRSLAPGCRACARGEWSCLFISGLCNAHCFFCPTTQDEMGDPMTATVVFREPQDYADYLRVFGFAGASISGGEPLLRLEDSLRFLRTVRGAMGPDFHLWLYTNGTCATRETMVQLRDAGLDEIRFNITATGLDLSGLLHAVGVIPTVTVEIPAVPEMEPALRRAIMQLAEAGVDHLNLHQLRLTGHNLPQLARRDYTFLHGPSATVLESELTALRLLRWTLEQGVALPVNYCSFVYRHRTAGRAARLRGVPFARKPGEEITAAGYLRQTVPQPDGTVAVTHHECRVVANLSYRRMFHKVSVNPRRDLYVERAPVAPATVLDAQEAAALAAGTHVPGALAEWEVMEQGLAAYW